MYPSPRHSHGLFHRVADLPGLAADFTGIRILSLLPTWGKQNVCGNAFQLKHYNNHHLRISLVLPCYLPPHSETKEPDLRPTPLFWIKTQCASAGERTLRAITKQLLYSIQALLVKALGYRAALKNEHSSSC